MPCGLMTAYSALLAWTDSASVVNYGDNAWKETAIKGSQAPEERSCDKNDHRDQLTHSTAHDFH